MISGVFFAGTQSLQIPVKRPAYRHSLHFLVCALCRLRILFFNKCALSTAVTLFFSGHYHMWFLFMIGTVSDRPAAPIAQNETCCCAIFWLRLRLFFNFLLPQLGALLLCFPAALAAATSRCLECYTTTSRSAFAAYFMLAAISAARSCPKRARWCYALGVAGLIVTVVMTSYASCRLGTATVLFYNYDSVGVLLLMETAVFVFARRHLNFPHSAGTTARIRALRWSFGAYLVHPLFIETFDHFSASTRSPATPFLRAPLDAAHRHAVLLVSALLSRVPIVNKYLPECKRSAGRWSALLCVRSIFSCCDKEVRRRGKQVFGLQHLKASCGDGRLQRVHTVKRHIGYFLWLRHHLRTPRV